ncbi:peptidoglycan/LPS O-acetylase OafA/YrhL [Paenibacillus shirakamiensis]|uniref:Peptidoglycan/LPS O-acetylase OafA/YrhL n=1 Tax=Paenibacillus shirakamiensis TaxID=1265935 RepID=A0ABS4JBW4_9BACL|nr:hypothetical protein [Paenibacillus shirakamiensis]MBP1999193.1 peptidoglycan/LPS O-acetylase OafA/YrhL [Paenibacillus shirakamiensis]
MSQNNRLVTGIFILVAGIVILLGKWGVFSFIGRAFWPLVFLIPGILLHLYYFRKREAAIWLVPAGILSVYGILFFIGNFAGSDVFSYIWPLFILGIAVGLFEYDALGSPRPQGILLIALILMLVTIVLLFFTLTSVSLITLLAIMLMIGGIWIILARGRSSRGW